VGVWPRRVIRFWRRSLEFRTIAITVILSSIAVTVIGSAIAISIGSNIYAQRKQQIESESERATVLAQSIFDSATATEDSNQVQLDSLQNQAQSAILSTTSSPGGTSIAMLRSPGQTTSQTIQNIASPDFPNSAISKELRTAVDHDTDKLHFQPVSLSTSSGRSPGIAVGSILDVPTAGQYELYLVYDLSDAQKTLDFMQQTLAIGSIALVLLIAVITYIVVRLVVGPIRLAAETSEKIAAGHLEERIPEAGEDVIATLGRSFNGMADTLQRQIQQLADLSRMQQRFVSDVSHELRTPLTTIRLAGDMLYRNRGDFDPLSARTAELLHTQVDRFERLLADLLEISRYDAGAVELELEPVALVRLVDESVEEFGPLAEEVGSTITVEAPGGHFEAEVDPRRVRRILRNLLGNAIEHGEGRPIRVTVDSDAESVAIAVDDRGVGMRPDQAALVFDRFWRADPSRKRSIGGTGLGLSISREDAQLHGGRLEVWSAAGVGTRFVVTLPRHRGAVATTSPIPVSRPPSFGAQEPITTPAPDREVTR
jgi:two-component system sensor histidine kinase MtrB